MLVLKNFSVLKHYLNQGSIKNQVFVMQFYIESCVTNWLSYFFFCL